MKRLGLYMTAAAISLGIAGTTAISAQASCRNIVIGGDVLPGGNSFSCGQLMNSSCGQFANFSFGQPIYSSCGQSANSSCGQFLGNSCTNLQSILSTISSYYPNTNNFNNNCTNNFIDDEKCFPGQCPGTNRPTESRPEQNNTNVNNKPEQNKPSESNKPNQNTSGENTSAQSYVQQVINLVNEERAKAGLSPLTESSAVSKAAAVRAEEIVKNFSHTRPDGTSFSTVLRQNGISFSSSGENIAYGQRTPQEVMNTWMNSSGHRANILNSNYTTIGVGCYQAGNGTIYWTQLFTR